MDPTTPVSASRAGATRRVGPLINRPFGLLWAGHTISTLGDFVFNATLVVWIGAQLAKGQPWAPLAVSGVFVAASVPVFVVGPLAGVFVDRWDKRRTMVLSDVLRAVLVAVLIVATGAVSLPGGAPPPLGVRLGLIYGAVFLLNALERFFRPAMTALIGDLVAEEHRARATGLTQVSFSVAILLGPTLAPLLYIAVGPALALAINAASYLVSVLTLLPLRAAVAALAPVAAAEGAPSGGVGREFRAGLAFFVRSRTLVTVSVAAMIVMIGGGAINALDFFFVTATLGAPVAAYGVAEGAMGLGLLVGAILASALVGRIGLGRSIWLSLLLLGVAIVVYSRMTALVPAMVVLFLAGTPQAALNTAIGPLLLRETPRELLGRVMSLLDPLVMVATMAGTAVSGYLAANVLSGFSADALGMHFGAVDTIFTVAGGIALVGAVYAAIGLRGTDDAPEMTPAPQAEATLPEALPVA